MLSSKCVQAREAGESVKSGVTRSGTPGLESPDKRSPQGGRQLKNNEKELSGNCNVDHDAIVIITGHHERLPPVYTGLGFTRHLFLGLTPQALCYRLLRRLSTNDNLMIQIAAQQHSEIAAHGERDYPYECCGLLLGRFTEDGAKACTEIYPISNAREEAAKRNRFLIRPEELMRGEKEAAAKGLEVVGFYHSHPDHPAVPSQYDLEHAWPSYSYIVLAVGSGRAGDFRSWEMQTDRSRFNEEDIVLKGN